MERIARFLQNVGGGIRGQLGAQCSSYDVVDRSRSLDGDKKVMGLLLLDLEEEVNRACVQWA
jgi:hypothetical protein